MILHQDWDQTEIRLRSDWDQTQLATTIGCLVFWLVDLDFLYYTKGLIPWLGGFHSHDKHSFIVWSSFGAFNWCILLDLKQWYCVTCKPSRPLVSGRRVFFFFFFSQPSRPSPEAPPDFRQNTLHPAVYIFFINIYFHWDLRIFRFFILFLFFYFLKKLHCYCFPLYFVLF